MVGNDAIVNVLRDAKRGLKHWEDDTRAEITRQYKRLAEEETERQVMEKRREFAGCISDAVAAGVPRSRIRSEVLRTNVWSVWTYWADLAGLSSRKTGEQVEEGVE